MNINWPLVALIVGFAFYGFLAWLAAKRLVSSGLRQIPGDLLNRRHNRDSRSAEGQYKRQRQCQRRD